VGWAHLLLAAALSMSIADFIELQKLSPADLRTRFSLPAACDPSLAALTTDPAANQVTVAVDCRPIPAGAQPQPGSAGQPPRQPSKKDLSR
jgi:hypothetical protein